MKMEVVFVKFKSHEKDIKQCKILDPSLKSKVKPLTQTNVPTEKNNNKNVQNEVGISKTENKQTNKTLRSMSELLRDKKENIDQMKIESLNVFLQYDVN